MFVIFMFSIFTASTTVITASASVVIVIKFLFFGCVNFLLLAFLT